jgi:Sortilin, neurotensin receptor 3,
MRLRRVVDAATGWRSLIIASMLITNITAQKDAPSITAVPFDNQPNNIEYFDDSDVIIFQDWESGTVYRTDNAGETWSKVNGTPITYEDAWSMYMHPFDKERAYVLTKESTHYMTDDRGATWQSFFTDALPSAWRDPPLSFHADDPNKIIFNGMNCMGIFCEELVRGGLGQFSF